MADNINLMDVDGRPFTLATKDIGGIEFLRNLPLVTDQDWQAIVAVPTGTTQALIKAPPAGMRVYVTGLVLSAAAGTTSVSISIQDGSSAMAAIYTPAALGTLVIPFRTPLRTSLNASFNVQCAAAAGGNINVNAQGFFAP